MNPFSKCWKKSEFMIRLIIFLILLAFFLVFALSKMAETRKKNCKKDVKWVWYNHAYKIYAGKEKKKKNLFEIRNVIMFIVGNTLPVWKMFTRVRAGGYLIKKQRKKKFYFCLNYFYSPSVIFFFCVIRLMTSNVERSVAVYLFWIHSMPIWNCQCHQTRL